MSKSSIYISLGLTILYLIGSIHFVKLTESENAQSREFLEERAKLLDYSDRLLNLQEWLTEVVYQEKRNKAEQYVKLSEIHHQNAIENALISIGISFIYAISLLFVFGKKHRVFALFFSVAFIGITFLLQGVFNPMMQIEAYKTNLTVKAKLTPINTPEYNRGKELLDEMNLSLTKEIDSLIDTLDKNLTHVDSKMEALKENLNSSADLIKNLPIVGASSSQKLKDLAIELPVPKPMLFPFIMKLRERLVMIKDSFRDSLIAASDKYASETYGINKVFPDKTYFYFQQKSIFDVIVNLWKSQNYIVSIALALFSVFIPFFKLLISVFLLLVKKVNRYFPQKILTSISKWSMADVFVASSFLTYMSFSNLQVGVEIESSVCFGLYFFLSYAVLSILLSVLLKKSLILKEKDML